MKKEEKELLLSLLEKAKDEGLLHIYDSNENIYGIYWTSDTNWLSFKNEIVIKIKKYDTRK